LFLNIVFGFRGYVGEEGKIGGRGRGGGGRGGGGRGRGAAEIKNSGKSHRRVVKRYKPDTEDLENGYVED